MIWPEDAHHAEPDGDDVEEWLSDLMDRHSARNGDLYGAPATGHEAGDEAPRHDFGLRGGRQAETRGREAPGNEKTRKAGNETRDDAGGDPTVGNIYRSLERISRRISDLQRTEAAEPVQESARAGNRAQPDDEPPARNVPRRQENRTAGRIEGRIGRERLRSDTPATPGRAPAAGRRAAAPGGSPSDDPSVMGAVRKELTHLRNVLERRADEDNAALREEVRTIREVLSSQRGGFDSRVLERAQGDVMKRLDMIRQMLDQPRDVSDLNSRLSEIRRLVSAIPTERELTGITGRLDLLADHLDRIDTLEEQLSKAERIAENLEHLPDLRQQLAQMSEIGRRIESLPRIAAELDQRLEMLPRIAEDMATVRRSILDGRREDTRTLDSLVGRVGEIATRLDSPGFQRGAGDLAALEQRLGDVAARLEGFSGRVDPRSLHELERRISVLARDLDDRLAEVETGTSDAIAHHLQAFESRQANRDSAEADYLENRLADLAHRIDGAVGPDLAQQIVRSIGRLESVIANQDRQEPLAGLEQRLADMAATLEQINNLTPQSASQLVTEVAGLRHQVEKRMAPALSGMEEELGKLGQKLEQLTESQPDPALLGQIENRLVRLAGAVEQQPAASAWLQEAFSRLEAQLSTQILQSSRDMQTLALSSAREAVSALGVRDSDGMADALGKLTEGFAGLRQDFATAGDRDRASLDKIIDLLGKVIAAGGTPGVNRPVSAQRIATGAEMPVEPEPAPVRAGERPLPRQAAAPADARAPQPAAGRSDPRAEFIAAARRAAQGDGAAPGNSRSMLNKVVPGAAPAPKGAPTPLAAAGVTAATGTKQAKSLLKGGLSRKLLVYAGFAVVAIFVARIAVPLLTRHNEVAQPVETTAPAAPVDLSHPVKTEAIALPSTLDDRTPPAAATETEPSPVMQTGKGNAIAAPSPTSGGVPSPSRPVPELLPPPPGDDGTGKPLSALSPTTAPKTETGSGTGAAVAMLPPAPPPPSPPLDKATDHPGEPTAATPDAASPAVAAAPIPDPLPEQIGTPALHKAVEAGDRKAVFTAAQLMLQSLKDGTAVGGITMDKAQATLKHAVDLGFAPAMYQLGIFYQTGQGVRKDPIAALQLETKAAELGNVHAMYNLGILYTEGTGGPSNSASAAQWFAKAADYGLRDSQFNLGILYSRGQGVEKDLANAYKWLDIAARSGDQEAARDRDQISPLLDASALAQARLASSSWRAKPMDAQANDTRPDPAWMVADMPPTGSVNSGKSGNPLIFVQTRLAALGYDVSRPDGVMGEKTRAAIMAFQRAHGLPVTGTPDQRLMEMLTAAK